MYYWWKNSVNYQHIDKSIPLINNTQLGGFHSSTYLVNDKMINIQNCITQVLCRESNIGNNNKGRIKAGSVDLSRVM